MYCEEFCDKGLSKPCTMDTDWSDSNEEEEENEKYSTRLWLRDSSLYPLRSSWTHKSCLADVLIKL